MKRQIMALLLAATLVVESICTVPVFANEVVENTVEFTATAENANVFVENGSTATLTVNATGNDLSFAWYAWEGNPRRGWWASEPIADATTSAYVVEGSNTMAPKYKCVVTENGVDEPIEVEFNLTLIEGTVGVNEEMSIMSNGGTHYYKFVSPITKVYSVYTTLNTANSLAVYDAEMNYLAGSEQDWETGKMIPINCELEAGKTYYVAVTMNWGGMESLFVDDNSFYANADQTEIELYVNTTTDLVVNAGDEAGAVTYQWYASEDSSAYEPIENATGSAYTLNGAAPETVKGFYRCEVTNHDGLKTKTVDFTVTLTTDLKAVADGYTLVHAEDGKEVTLSVNVTGGYGEVTTKWQKYDNANWSWVDVPEASASAYSITFVKNGDAMYRYVAADAYKTVNVNFNIYEALPQYVLGATLESGEYQFIPTVSGIYEFTISSTNYADITINDGNDDVISYTYASSPDGSVVTEVAAEEFVAGEVYYLEVYLSGNDTIKGAYDIEGCGITVADATYGNAPVVTVTFGDKELVLGTDYTVSVNTAAAAGTANITITGIGNFTGSVTKTYKVNAITLANGNVTVQNVVFDGTAKKPVVVKVGNVTLKEGVDYKATYTNNVAAGTATVVVVGIGNYAGKVTKTFTIAAASISGATVTVDAVNYDGTAKVPAIKVVLGGKTLVAGTDYTYTVSNNVNKGTAAVVVTGKGNYAGTKNASFVINAASIANAKVTVKDVQYKGKAVKPAVRVKIGNVTLKEGTDYTVKYSKNNKIGTAKVTITGKGNYTGTKTASFKVKKGAKVTVGSYTYEITGNDTVAFAGIVKSKVKKTKTVKIADTVKISGKKFKVTAINAKALKGNTKVKSVTIGKNVKTIGKEAFSGAKNLKTITVKATGLKTVGKNAFKGINKKATIKVPSKQLKKYKTLLKKGQAKSVKIKK